VSDTVHATAVALGEDGVLVRGDPGAGKSALARALITLWQGAGGFAALVADDRTALARAGGALIARPPAPLAGRIEVRGVGILRVPYLDAVRLSLVVDLVEAPERLPADADRTTALMGVNLPRLVFPKGSADDNASTLRWVLDHGALTPPSAAAQRDPCKTTV